MEDVVKVVKVTVIEEETEDLTEAAKAAEKTQAFLIVIPAVVVAILVVAAVVILLRVCAKKRQSQQIIIKKALEEAQAGEDIGSEAQNVQYIMEADGKADIFSRPQSKASGKRVKIGIMPNSRKGKRKAKQQEDNVSEAQKPQEEEVDDGFNNYSDTGKDASSRKFDMSSRSSILGRGNDTLRAFAGYIAKESELKSDIPSSSGSGAKEQEEEN